MTEVSAKLPTDFVTFLFVDAALGKEEMRELARGIEIRGGSAYKREDNVLCCAFGRSRDAVLAAYEYHKKFSSGSGTLRTIIHSGKSSLKNGAYSGSVVDFTRSMLASSTAGGTILLSHITKELVGETLSEAFTFRDLGLHAMENGFQPIHVFQVIHPDLPETLSKILLKGSPTADMTSFVGRVRELEAVQILLKASKLVTLTGSGGVGKTRLALKSGEVSAEFFPDGVWLAELASVTNPELVPQTVAAAFGVREQSGRPVLEALLYFLQDKKLLLILDNCEHVLDAAKALAQQLFENAESLRVLATSRQALGIAGEAIYRVPSLSVPESREEESVEDLKCCEAGRLFLERIPFSPFPFRLTPQNAKSALEICRRLDGIPLAIELAAARVKDMSPEKILARLTDTFRMFAGGPQGVPSRQQTLHNAIEWSHELLSPAERVLMRRLSVFMGSFSAEAACSACSGDGVEERLCEELLSQLVAKSLLEEEIGGRYRFLETIREYAFERLHESGETARLKDRHLDYFSKFVEEGESKFYGAEEMEWKAKLDVDYQNLRSALEWAKTAQDRIEKGLRLASAFWWFWYTHDYYQEGVNELMCFLQLTSPDTPAKAKAVVLLGAGRMIVDQGDYALGRPLMQQALAIFKKEGDDRGIARALRGLGSLAWREGEIDHSIAYNEESLRLFRVSNDKFGVALNLMNMGSCFMEKGEYEKASSLYQESMAMAKTFGNKRLEALNRSCLGYLELKKRNFEKSIFYCKEALSCLHESKDEASRMATLDTMGQAAISLGNFNQAKVYFKECLMMSKKSGYKRYSICACYFLGKVLCKQENHLEAFHFLEEGLSAASKMKGDREVAASLNGFVFLAIAKGKELQGARLLGAVNRLRASFLPVLNEQDEFEECVIEAKAALGEEKFTEAFSEGRNFTLSQAIQEALALGEPSAFKPPLQCAGTDNVPPQW